MNRRLLLPLLGLMSLGGLPQQKRQYHPCLGCGNPTKDNRCYKCQQKETKVTYNPSKD